MSLNSSCSTNVPCDNRFINKGNFLHNKYMPDNRPFNRFTAARNTPRFVYINQRWTESDITYWLTQKREDKSVQNFIFRNGYQTLLIPNNPYNLRD